MTADDFHLAPAGAFDLASLASLRSELMLAAERSGPDGALRIDLSGVEAADVGFLQLVLSLQRSLAAQGRGLALRPSAAVADLFRSAGATVPAAG